MLKNIELVLMVTAVFVSICSTCFDDYDIFSVPCPDYHVCRCARFNGTVVLCCGITSPYLFKESLACSAIRRSNTTSLYIRNSEVEELNASLPLWSELKTLNISTSKVNRIVGTFKGSLTCVNISSNSINEIALTAFKDLDLTSLDLSNNNLTKLPHISSSDNVSLDISGNPKLQCSSVKDLMLQVQNSSAVLSFYNYNNTSCLSSWSFHWFNSTEVVPLAQLEIMIRVEQECPKSSQYTCQCSSSGFDIRPGKPPTSAVKVDCSGQQLSSLPSHLPPNTIFLNVTNNNITHLDPLSLNASYHDIREFYADNNNIESINVLEGSHFIRTFSILSLKGNKLKSIPTYILSDTFDRNLHTRHVKLGDNRLNCDCNTAQILKMWLLTHKVHIPDYDEVLCENVFEKVINLDPNKLCIYQKDWTDYIYYIIAAEVLLLCLLISKVSYDYWVFKTVGYLPWPASKMPKLPCDWVFET